MEDQDLGGFAVRFLLGSRQERLDMVRELRRCEPSQLAELETLLASDDEQFREAAVLLIEALGRRGAQTTLEAQLVLERSSHNAKMIEVVESALARLEASGPPERRPIQHPQLGLLHWEANAYTRRARNGAPALRLIPPEGYAETKEFLDAASARIDHILRRMDVAKQIIVESLIDTYNEDWRDSDSPELDDKKFSSRLDVTSVEIDGTLAGAIWFDDRNLFAGHAIEVPFGADGRFGNSARLHG